MPLDSSLAKRRGAHIVAIGWRSLGYVGPLVLLPGIFDILESETNFAADSAHERGAVDLSSEDADSTILAPAGNANSARFRRPRMVSSLYTDSPGEYCNKETPFAFVSTAVPPIDDACVGYLCEWP